MTPRRVRTPALLATLSAVALFISAASLLGVLDPEASGEGWTWWAAAWVFVPLLLAARTLRMSVEVTPDGFVIRNYLRTIRISREQVTDIRWVVYDGWLVRNGPSRSLRTVQFQLQDRAVTAWGLVGRSKVIARCVARIEHPYLPYRPETRAERRKHAR